MGEEKKSSCSTSNNCYAIVALCVSFLAIGLILGNWMGKCSSSKKGYSTKKCQSYSFDAKTGSTCSWSKTEKTYKKECKKDSIKNIN